MDQLLNIDIDTLHDHIFRLYVEHKPSERQHLGYVDKSTETLDVTLPRANIDLTISQSLTSLSGSASSTGFVCWQSSVNFADWLLTDPLCPFREMFLPFSSVLELGAGVGGVLASVLGPRVGRYVATDQKHVLKLLKANFAANVVSQRYQTSTSTKSHGGPKQRTDETWSTIDFLEFDWEHVDAGSHAYLQLAGSRPDVILATDTIYNQYLVPYFVASLNEMMDNNTTAIVTIQLRDEDVTECFLQTVLDEGLQLYVVPDNMLDATLLEGFMVYCIRRA